MHVKDVDFKFLKAMDIVCTESKNPYQLFCKHPDVQGKFVWYPTTGALVFEPPVGDPTRFGTALNEEDLFLKIMTIV